MVDSIEQVTLTKTMRKSIVRKKIDLLDHQNAQEKLNDLWCSIVKPFAALFENVAAASSCDNGIDSVSL